jgi:hypothetical protein
MMKNIYEILEEIEKAKSKEDRIAILRYNSSWALQNVLKGTYDSSIQFSVDKIPTYKPSDAPPGLGYSSIHQELGRAYLFEKNNPKVNPNLTEKRKEQILIQMLECLEAKEAQVLCNMILKKPLCKGLNYNVVKEAFPDLIT